MSATIYNVKKYDTISDIAKANKTTVNAILKLNPNITNPDVIYEGQKIKIAETTKTTTNTTPTAKNYSAIGKKLDEVINDIGKLKSVQELEKLLG